MHVFVYSLWNESINTVLPRLHELKKPVHPGVYVSAFPICVAASACLFIHVILFPQLLRLHEPRTRRNSHGLMFLTSSMAAAEGEGSHDTRRLAVSGDADG